MARDEKASDDSASFEALYAQLEELTARLEAGKLGLEESIALYEESAGLVERLRAVLDAAEVRVQDVRGRLEVRRNAEGRA